MFAGVSLSGTSVSQLSEKDFSTRRDRRFLFRFREADRIETLGSPLRHPPFYSDDEFTKRFRCAGASWAGTANHSAEGPLFTRPKFRIPAASSIDESKISNDRESLCRSRA
jgi:hypothetical protein